MSAVDIQRNLSKTVAFIEPLMPLVTSHMVNFITHSLFQSLIPVKLSEEVHEFGFDKVINVMFEHCSHKRIAGNSEMSTFLNLIQDLHINNRTVDYFTLSDFKHYIYKKGCKKFDVVPFNEFMSGKKCHEVSLMSSIVAEISDLSKSSVIVDIGDGKGYLSSFLALEYKLRVLGIDSSSIKTSGAAKRISKLSKVWKGTRKKIVGVHGQENISEGDRTSTDYLQVTEFISQSTNISDIISREFGETPSNFGLVGLHTCGDLSPDCLRLFARDSSQSFLVNVGCCYHLMTDERGFPMSQYLRSCSFHLSRNARMVSLRPKWKIGSNRSLPNESLLYRAILQKILVDKQGPDLNEEFQVGRIASKCTSFHQYVRMALNKLKLNIEISESEIEWYLNNYSSLQNELTFYFMFVTCISSLIEDIILLDKLLYLKEQGFEDSYLVEMFDPILSPRCHALIALRKNKANNV